MLKELAADDARPRQTSSETKPFPVYVIDDNSDLRRSLHFLLAVSKITAWPFAAAEDFLAQLGTLTPGPILLDLRMTGLDGIETLTAMRQRDVTWPVILMSAHGDIAVAVKAMKLGAIEFLEKPFTAELLDVALAQAFAVLDGAQTAVMVKTQAKAALRKLSPREVEVVSHLVEGAPNKVVAHRLDLSTRTVEMHRRNAFAKLGLKSIAELVALVGVAGSEPAMVGAGRRQDVLATA